MKELVKQNRIERRGALVVVIMDGVGIGAKDEGDAFHLARTPLLDELISNYPGTILRAHGIAVGLPSDGDMGNSEVGHNALGAGKIYAQGAKLVQQAVRGSLFEGKTWKELVAGVKKSSGSLHFIGLLSDGNVHSHIDHLFTMVDRSAEEGVQKVRIHILLDGRDVPETSSTQYIDSLEAFLEKHRSMGKDYVIASGGGRMVTTMDRYQADWSVVEKGWQAHVLGEARGFSSAREAVDTYYREIEGITDQYLPSFTITGSDGTPLGPIVDGDSVIFFNFRGDRAMEISMAFDSDDFHFFDRKRRPDVLYAGMMEYDGDLHIPLRYLVEPPHIEETMSEYLANTGARQFAISETQKFGHVTYFWNGNRSGKFSEELEDYLEVPSDRVEFDQRPWMKAAEITDETIKAIQSGKYDFIRLNYPNGDMVGHTGNVDAAVIAIESVDLSLTRLLKAVDHAGGMAVITADHGNLDEMYEIDKKTGSFKMDKETGAYKKKTSHTLNPVPIIFYDPHGKNEYRISPEVENPGLANVAATLLLLLGYETPEGYEPSIIELA